MITIIAIYDDDNSDARNNDVNGCHQKDGSQKKKKLYKNVTQIIFVY